MSNNKTNQVDFTLFLSTLAMQAYIALGELEDPNTKKTQLNLAQADYMMKLLQLIKEKTNGNLNDGEGKALNHLIDSVQSKYEEKSCQA